MNSYATTAQPSIEPVLIMSQLNPYADELTGYQDDNMKHKAEQVAQNNAAVRKMHAAKQSRKMEDLTQGFAELEKLAQVDPPFLPAVVNVAYCLQEGLGTLPEIKRSVSLLGKAAELNYAPAQTYLGLIEKDKQKAEKYFHQAAAQNNRGALFQLYLHNIDNNLEQAKECLLSAAHLGHARAQFLSFQVYYAGHYGFAVDQKEAFINLEKSAKQNYPDALYAKGIAINALKIVGMAKQTSTTEFFRKAAKFDHVKSMLQLAESCPEEKMQWLERAAKLGDAKATQQYALMTSDSVKQEQYFKLLAKEYEARPLNLLKDIELFTGMLPYLAEGVLPVLYLDSNHEYEDGKHTIYKVRTVLQQFSQAMKKHRRPELTELTYSVNPAELGNFDFILDIVAQLYSLMLRFNVTPEPFLQSLFEKLAPENKVPVSEQKSPPPRLMTLKIIPKLKLSEDKATVWARAFSKQTSLVELSLALDITKEVAAILFAPFITIPNQPEDIICVELQSLQLEIYQAEIIIPLAVMLSGNSTLKKLYLTLLVDSKADAGDQLTDAIAKHPALTEVSVETAARTPLPNLLAQLNKDSPIHSLRSGDDHTEINIGNNQTALCSLHIGNSIISSEQMVDFVKHNPQLQSLQYSGWSYDVVKASTCIDLIKLNQLSRLEVPGLILDMAAVEQALANNTTLTELQPEYFSPAGEHYNKDDPATVNIKNRLEANKLTQDTKILHWSRICFAIAFVRENQTSTLCTSFLALLPDIDQYQFGDSFRLRLFKCPPPNQQITVSAPLAVPSARH